MTSRIFGGLDGDFLYRCVATSRENPKVISMFVSGFNPSVAQNTKEDLWDVGGTRVEDYTPVAISTVSTDANDTAAGTGARMVRISGLDQNGDMAEEFVSLNGLTPVLTVGLFSFIYNTSVVLSGSAGNALGVITSSAGGSPQALINQDINHSEGAFFRVPRGYTGFFTDTYVSGGPNDDFVADYRVKAVGTNTFVTVAGVEISNSSLYSAGYSPPAGPIVELMIIKIRCIAESANVRARGNFNMTIIRNDYLAELVETV